MKLSQQSQAIIESAIQKAINKYTCGCEQTIVTDIHIQPNQNSGELFIYDDEDEELSSVTIDEWTAYEGDDFCEDAERIFRRPADCHCCLKRRHRIRRHPVPCRPRIPLPGGFQRHRK